MNTLIIQNTPPNKDSHLRRTWKRCARFVMWISSILISLHHAELACAEAMAAPVERSAIDHGVTVLTANGEALNAGTAFLAGLNVLHASGTAFLGYFLVHWGAALIALFCLFETGHQLGKGASLVKRWWQGFRH